MTAGKPWQAVTGGPTFPGTSCLAWNNIKVRIYMFRVPKDSTYRSAEDCLNAYTKTTKTSPFSLKVWSFPPPTYFSYLPLHSSSHSIHENVGNDIYTTNFASDKHYTLNGQAKVGTERKARASSSPPSLGFLSLSSVYSLNVYHTPRVVTNLFNAYLQKLGIEKCFKILYTWYYINKVSLYAKSFK
jgi:hypothetical protein